MDLFSLLRFWRTTGDPSPAGDYDEDSFFDLVFTCDSKSSFRFSSPDNFSYNKRRISPLDSSNTKTNQTPQSPLRLLKLRFQNNHNRDNSLRHQLRTEQLLENDQAPSKRFSKDVINRYLNLMKPSYVAVSKRSAEKSRLSEASTTPSSSPASSVFSPRKEERKSGGLGTVFRGVRKHLGKSRSASEILQTPARKSDDSALEQQDGIQGAILHCKRSYNSLKVVSYQDLKVLRSVEEQKRSSI